MQGELHYLLLKCFRGSHKFIVQETSKISLLPGQPKVLECLRGAGWTLPQRDRNALRYRQIYHDQPSGKNGTPETGLPH